MTYMYFVEWDVKPKLNYSVTYSKIYFNLVPSIYTPDVIEIGRPFCGRTNRRDPSKFKNTKIRDRYQKSGPAEEIGLEKCKNPPPKF